MDLADLRQRLLARVRRGDSQFDPEEVDWAIIAALQEMSLTSYHSLSLTSALAFSANNPQLDISSLNLRPETIKRAELAYTDRGTWSAASVSYVVNDLVQGDGTPDSKFYVNKLANTSSASNEPGTSGGETFWTARKWQRGDVIRLLDRETIGRIMGDKSYVKPWLPADFYDYWFSSGADDATGIPCVGGFWTDALFYVYPVPDAAYKVVFLKEQDVDAWDAGTAAYVALDVPDKVLLPAIDGMAAILDPNHPQAQVWRQRFDRHVQRVDGGTLINVGEAIKDRAQYLDHTDYLDNLYWGR